MKISPTYSIVTLIHYTSNLGTGMSRVVQTRTLPQIFKCQRAGAAARQRLAREVQSVPGVRCQGSEVCKAVPGTICFSRKPGRARDQARKRRADQALESRKLPSHAVQFNAMPRNSVESMNVKLQDIIQLTIWVTVVEGGMVAGWQSTKRL